ncbi:hypothetical protein Adt_34584 [Abeliophyllum distichum]|uniref:Uncharacterized protein n=1 Tax=Abeliophyllum distichum TaxID=126358 RepID=A0ABD1QZL8_9LAMI
MLTRGAHAFINDLNKASQTIRVGLAITGFSLIISVRVEHDLMTQIAPVMCTILGVGWMWVPFWKIMCGGSVFLTHHFQPRQDYFEAQDADQVGLVRFKPPVEKVDSLLDDKVFNPASLKKVAKRKAWLDAGKKVGRKEKKRPENRLRIEPTEDDHELSFL